MNTTNKNTTISIRVSNDLLNKLKTLSTITRLDISTLIRRCARYVANSGDSFTPPYQDRGNTTNVNLDAIVKARNCPAVKCDDKTFRDILEARCDDALKTCGNYLDRQFHTELKEGRDYIVEKEEQQ